MEQFFHHESFTLLQHRGDRRRGSCGGDSAVAARKPRSFSRGLGRSRSGEDNPILLPPSTVGDGRDGRRFDEEDSGGDFTFASDAEPPRGGDFTFASDAEPPPPGDFGEGRRGRPSTTRIGFASGFTSYFPRGSGTGTRGDIGKCNNDEVDMVGKLL